MWNVLCPAVLRLIQVSALQCGMEVDVLFSYFWLPECIHPVLILFLEYNFRGKDYFFSLSFLVCAVPDFNNLIFLVLSCCLYLKYIQDKGSSVMQIILTYLSSILPVF